LEWNKKRRLCSIMSVDMLTAFDFVDQKSFVHDLDPRTKFMLVLVYMTLLIMYDEILFNLVILGSIIPLVFLAKLTKSLVKSLRSMGFLFFFIILLNTIMLSLGFGIQMALRLVNILIVFSLLFRTTSPDDIAQAVMKLGISYQLAFSLSLAFRFVPTLAKEAMTISDAQRSRGYEVQKGGIFQQLRNLIPLLVPLISNSIQRAYYVAESLEARSFGLKGVKRVNLFPIRMSIVDYIFLIWLLGLLIIGILIMSQVISIPSWLYLTLPI
jgi:energy-coupling factor transport system permease protein